VVEIINLDATVLGRVDRPQLPALARGSRDPRHARSGERRAFFAAAGGFVATPVFAGAKLLVNNLVSGPAIIEEETTTIVVFPGWDAELTDPGMYSMVVRG
jgi:N-methylhydantoinase A